MGTNNLQPFSMIEGLVEHFKDEKCLTIETHISWIVITDKYAYKIKKSLDLGFLDFSTLEKRLHFCREEIRLNKKFAPDIYLCVIPITGTLESPKWDGDGKPIEYAVKMRAFPQDKQLDRVLDAGLLKAEQFDLLADYIGKFHEEAEVAPGNSDYGSPEKIFYPVQENFIQIREHCRDKDVLKSLSQLEKWSSETFDSLFSTFIARKKYGFIRECHGDLHLRNLAWVENRPVAFDCIEFDPYLRWIDTINDLAFLVMDLDSKNQSRFANRFINKYLEYNGDYESIPILKFYLVYKALIRAKISAIRGDQPGISSKEKALAKKKFQDYLKLALDYTKPVTPLLIITRGMSASGKSTISQQLAESLGALRIRTDVERKRLFGLRPEDKKENKIDQGIYGQSATEKTYSKLEEFTEKIVNSKHSVIVDGVFMHYWQRELFRELAKKKNIPFIILEFVCDIKTLQKRIVERKNKENVSDADLKVLEHQYTRWEPLNSNEICNSVTIDTGRQVNIKILARQLKEKT